MSEREGAICLARLRAHLASIQRSELADTTDLECLLADSWDEQFILAGCPFLENAVVCPAVFYLIEQMKGQLG